MRTVVWARWIVCGGLVLSIPWSAGWVTRRLLYFPPSVRMPAPPAPFESIAITLTSGGRGEMWYVSPSHPRDPVVVYFHGNAENLSTLYQSGWLDEMGRWGVGILAVEYPGYSRDSGSPSERRIAEAADTAVAWLAEREPNRPIVLCGRSLGAAVAVLTASRHPGKIQGLIAMSPFASMDEAARTHFPGWLVTALHPVSERYPVVEAARKVSCPVLVFHGDRDRIVPFNQGRQVAAAFSPPARWIPLPGADHNDGLSRSALDEIVKFLREVSSK